MFCSRTSSNMINKIHERALGVILNDHENDFQTLLHNNNDLCNHHGNIQTPLIEIFKIKIGFAPPVLVSILKGEIMLTILEIFKNSRQKEKDLYILV